MITILIAQDEDKIKEILTQMLRQEGYCLSDNWGQDNIIKIIKPKICIECAVPTKKDTQKGAMQILPITPSADSARGGKAAFGGVNPASRNKLRRGGPKGRFCYSKIWVKKGSEKENVSLKDRILELEESLYREKEGILHKSILEVVEKALIEDILGRTEGNQLKAARILGINRNTLHTKIKKLGINPERYKQ